MSEGNKVKSADVHHACKTLDTNTGRRNRNKRHVEWKHQLLHHEGQELISGQMLKAACTPFHGSSAQGLRHSSNRQASNRSVQYPICGMKGQCVEIYMVLARRLSLLLA